MQKKKEHLRQDALAYHADGRPGKLEVQATKPLLSQRDLSLAYSPGVAEPCRRIAKNPEAVFDYTAKGNLVAVVSNGTAVLGLGNIGPLAGKPVMEGKSNLFKKFADIDCFDIELDAQTPEEVIAAVKAIAPTFGGINLEDIAAPDCFRIEAELMEALDIPVFHDDQHGTAIIACAAVLNAARVRGVPLEDMKIVFAGAGAAAIATARLLVSLGAKRENVWMVDVNGLIYKGREVDMFPEKAAFAQDTELRTLSQALVGADCFVGLSVGGILTGEMVKNMAPKPIIFAMANPDPEITYEDAKAAVPDAFVATGRSDYPNQVNNVLGFPFLFRGALDCRARRITQEMKCAAVYALAALAQEDVPDSVLSAYGLRSLSFGQDYLIPKPFDPRVLLWVAPAVAGAAAESGVARKPIADLEAYKQSLERLMERSREVIRPLMNRARVQPRRIVFPDGTHPKVLRAAQILVDEGICRPVLVGEGWKIVKRAEAHNVSLRGVEIIEIHEDERFHHYADVLWRRRQRKGMTCAAARGLLHQPTAYSAMMVAEGDADGLLGGVATPYNATLRPALQVIGPSPDTPLTSGVYAMLFKDRRIFFGDCTVNRSPSAEQLAQIAYNTAQVARTFGEEPRIAMLSFSDFGEVRGDGDVDRVRRATAIVRERWPDLVIDGEMQADTAVNPDMAATDFPFSAIQGDANVLIFPDLSSANIAYKLLRELGGATAVGPIIVGLARPVNVLALGATVDDIVNMAAITANQALDREAAMAGTP
jgi:malate dehydrogenase (oxaloacetate-decarboxylating)(NADP+)